jgi:hypothetical protein
MSGEHREFTTWICFRKRPSSVMGAAQRRPTRYRRCSVNAHNATRVPGFASKRSCRKRSPRSSWFLLLPLRSHRSSSRPSTGAEAVSSGRSELLDSSLSAAHKSRCTQVPLRTIMLRISVCTQPRCTYVAYNVAHIYVRPPQPLIRLRFLSR